MSYISLAKLTRYHNRLKTILAGKLDATGLVTNDTTEVQGYVPDATVVTAHGREIDALTVRVRTLETNFPDGCSTIAAAVTGGRDGNGTGGVTTASTASPSTIATNIRSMAQLNYDQGVTATKVGTAARAQVLTGYTFTNASTVGASGSMTNKGGTATSATASWDDTNTRVVLTIPATAYYTTSSTLYSAASNFGNAALTNVLADKTFTSTAGLKVAGTMVNKASTSSSAAVSWDATNSRVRLKVPTTGYYSTASYLYSAGTNFGNAALTNVLTGKTFTSSAGLNVTGSMPNNGTVPIATSAGTGHEIISFTAGYTSAVDVDKTATFESGTDHGVEITKQVVTNEASYTITKNAYTELGTYDLTGFTHVCYRLRVTSAVHVYTSYQLYINDAALSKKRAFNSHDEGSVVDSDNARGAIMTACLVIPEENRTIGQTLKIICKEAAYGANSFNCVLTLFAVSV